MLQQHTSTSLLSWGNQSESVGLIQTLALAWESPPSLCTLQNLINHCNDRAVHIAKTKEKKREAERKRWWVSKITLRCSRPSRPQLIKRENTEQLISPKCLTYLDRYCGIETTLELFVQIGRCCFCLHPSTMQGNIMSVFFTAANTDIWIYIY